MIDTPTLLELACTRTGLDGFGPATWQEGLDVLVKSTNAEAQLSPVGEAIVTAQAAASLANRLQVVDWHRRNPGAARPVDSPVFILGLPRTGTTLLSYLLDRDRANRSLLRWEAFASVPPPRGDSLRTESRVAVAAAEMDALYEVVPEFKAIHYESADGPTECVILLGQDFRSVHFETMLNIPTYGSWHESCDMRPAYRWHRLVLEVLQHDAPGRWVLKSPCHNLALDALIDVYPDARFVVPHRDPVIAVASVVSLVSVLTGLGTDHDFTDYIATRWLDACALMMGRYLDVRSRIGDDRFVDVRYRDLASDPLGTIAALYDRLGWDLSVEAESAMRTYLDENPAGRWGVHDYSLEQFGLEPRAISERFTEYLDRSKAFLE
jgi:hypothetical protein